MRIATTASIAVLALSAAALAQIPDASGTQPGNEIAINNASEPDNSYEPGPMPSPAPTPRDDHMGHADNMLDDSASPPPVEPK